LNKKAELELILNSKDIDIVIGTETKHTYLAISQLQKLCHPTMQQHVRTETMAMVVLIIYKNQLIVKDIHHTNAKIIKIKSKHVVSLL